LQSLSGIIVLFGRIVLESSAIRKPTSGRFRHCEEQSDEAIQASSFRDGPKDQTRNLEIPGSMLGIAPE